jgi:hypothetical protein
MARDAAAEHGVVMLTRLTNRMPRFFSVVFIGLLTGTAVSQERTGVVVGHMVDANTGKPSPRCTVQIVGRMVGAVCGANAAFIIDWAPPGTHTFEARRVGYERTRIERVQVVAGDTTRLTFKMVAAMDLERPIEFSPTTPAKKAEPVKQPQSEQFPKLVAPSPGEFEGVLVSKLKEGGQVRLDVLTQSGQFRGTLVDSSSSVYATLSHLREGDHVTVRTRNVWCTAIEKRR